MLIGIPCTSHETLENFMYKLKTPSLDFNLNFSQIKTISVKRLLRHICNVNPKTHTEVINKFIGYIKRKPTQ